MENPKFHNFTSGSHSLIVFLFLLAGIGGGGGQKQPQEMEKFQNVMVSLYLYTHPSGPTLLSTLSPSPLAGYTLTRKLGNCWGYPVSGSTALYEYTIGQASSGLYYRFYTTNWGENGVSAANFLGIPCYGWNFAFDGANHVYRWFDQGNIYTYDIRPDTRPGDAFRLQEPKFYLISS